MTPRPRGPLLPEWMTDTTASDNFWNAVSPYFSAAMLALIAALIWFTVGTLWGVVASGVLTAYWLAAWWFGVFEG